MASGLALLAALMLSQAPESFNCRYPSASCISNQFVLLSNNWLALDGTTSGTPNYGIRQNSASTRMEFNTAGVLAMFIDNGQNVTMQNKLTTSGFITITASAANSKVFANNTVPLTLQASAANGTGATPAIKLTNNTTLATVGDLLLGVDNNGALKVTADKDGYIASVTPFTLTDFFVNAVIPAGAQTYGKIILPARAFTVTALTYETSVAAVGAGTHTWQLTDGTNLCNCAANCTAETAAAAVRLAACTNAGGAGCVFPNTQTTISFTTLSSTCATSQATVLGNVRVEGNWQ